jgi:hypothetical protein
VTGPSVQLLVEAKGFRKGATFIVEQLPRELLCLQEHNGDRTPLLLLVLTTHPPIRLAGSGRHEVEAGVAVGLESLCARAGMTAEDYEALLASIPFCVAWITWSEIHTIVVRQKSPHRVAPPASLRLSIGPLTAWPKPLNGTPAAS